MPQPALKPVPPAPPDARRCQCGKIATILVTWGGGIVAYCDACETAEPPPKALRHG